MRHTVWWGYAFSRTAVLVSNFPNRYEQFFEMQDWNLEQPQYCFSSPTVKSGPSRDPSGHWAIDHRDHDHSFTTKALKQLCEWACVCVCVCVHVSKSKWVWSLLNLDTFNVPLLAKMPSRAQTDWQKREKVNVMQTYLHLLVLLFCRIILSFICILNAKRLIHSFYWNLFKNSKVYRQFTVCPTKISY